ncbi:MAG: hypothetical protein JHD23_08515 [Akkermansiaceae bacterium]|nr:hypothetical protein [Akkermansiaceae bacterium]
MPGVRSGWPAFELALPALSLLLTPTTTSRPARIRILHHPVPGQSRRAHEQGRSPVYLVHFTQNACADTARDLLSTNFCTKEKKTAIARALDDADFRSPYGRELSKILRHAASF